MKKMMSIAAVVLMMAGTAAYACDGCGCTAKKAEKKAECASCSKEKQADAKKCAEGCKKECCAKKAECGATK
ncbi:hypothetical protein [Pontiella sp.]|uniref:hypothetical protein n=1 Tax=Pontiella sp. TaxID=2837462 RepID=UPI003566EF5B